MLGSVLQWPVASTLFLSGETTEEVILQLFIVVAHIFRLPPHGLIDPIHHASPHFGDLGVVIPIQPDEVKPRVDSSSQLVFSIVQEGRKSFANACQNYINQGTKTVLAKTAVDKFGV